MVSIFVKPSSDIQYETQENVKPSVLTQVARSAEQGLINSSLVFASNLGRTAEDFFVEPSKVSPEQLNKQFGIEGKLKFDLPHTEEYAKDRQETIVRREALDRQLAIANQQNNLGDKAINLVTALGVGAVTSPETFINWTSAFKLHRLGAFNPFIAAAFKNPISRGAIDGAIGNLASEPLMANNYNYYGQDLTATDALFDVAAGGIFGAGFSGLGTLFRASKINNLKTTRSQVRAIETQLNKDAMGQILSVVDGHGANAETLDGILTSVIRLHSDNPKFELGDNIFLKENILRSNLDEAKAKFGDDFIGFLQNEKIIPENKYGGFNRAFDLFENQPGRIGELPAGMQKLVSKIGNRDGFITYRDLKEIIGNDFSGTQVKNLAAELRIDISSNSSKISSKEAFDLMQRIGDVERISKNAGAIDDVDYMALVKDFQRKMQETEPVSFVKFDKYQKNFNSLKTQIDSRPDLRDLTIKDFQSLVPEDQKLMLDYLRYFQEGNPTDSQLVDIFRNDEDALLDLYSQSQFNNKFKDSQSLQEATQNVSAFLENDKNILASKPMNMSFLNDIDTELGIKTQRLDAIIETEIGKVDPEIAKQIELEVNENVDAEVDGLMNGIREGVKCFLGIA